MRIKHRQNCTNLFFFQYQISFFKSITYQAYSRGTTGTRVLTESHKTYPIDFVCISATVSTMYGLLWRSHTPDSVFPCSQQNDRW